MLVGVAGPSPLAVRVRVRLSYAVVLMSVGIGVVGVVTATTASWFVERAATLSGNDDQEAATRGQVRELSRQLEAAVKGLPKGADESSPRHTRADPPPASS